MKKKTLTTGDISKYCEVNFRTVISWIDAGKLKAYNLPGRGDRRIKIEDFVDFLKHNGMPIPEDLPIGDEGKTKILIVEDDVNLARVMSGILEKKGFDTAIAYDGFQAGTMVESYSPDLMTLDLNMPGMGGHRVVKFIKSHDKYSKIKIIIVSAMSKEVIDGAVAEGADFGIRKPFEQEILVESINKLLMNGENNETE
ncbi:MAG: response regulator [Planctomycetota bacterium]|jgi:excisionase family DNA binding protein